MFPPTSSSLFIIHHPLSIIYYPLSINNMKKKTRIPQKTAQRMETAGAVQHTVTLAQAVQMGMKAHQAGDLSQAESVYQQILQVAPDNSEVLHLLGIIEGQRQNYVVAIDWFKKALAHESDNPSVYYNLGNAWLILQKYQEAVSCFQQAIALNPNYINAYNNLGAAWQRLGQFDQAAECFQQLLILDLHSSEGHSNLGNVYRLQGKREAAVACYQQSLAIQPAAVEVSIRLSQLFNELERLEEAFHCLQQALTVNPKEAQLHKDLGMLCYQQGNLTEAEKCFQQAVTLTPEDSELYNNLGLVYYGLDNFKNALAFYQRSLQLNPRQPETHNNLGVLLRQQGRVMEALSCYQQALSLSPNHLGFYNNLGLTLKDLGRVSEAIECYRNALSIGPSALVQGNLVFALNYAIDYDLAAIFAEHQRFNECYATSLSPPSALPSKIRQALPRKLRIGYVSADFYDHAVAHVIAPILANHDHQQFEIFCYYNNLKGDAITSQLQQYADHWLTCFGFSDDALAKQIRQDEIDILIDLSGHTAGHRLLTFARKPAPVQVTYLGYPNTTGLTSINYRITDALVDPVGVTDSFHSETLIRMPGSYFCYHPLMNEPFSINALPAVHNGYLTFGCLNGYYKLNPELLTRWARILEAVPNSKLLLKTKTLNDTGVRQNLLKQFAELGIGSDRVLLHSSSPAPQHLNTYHQIDIALDTFPFTGGITTFEALWMGVPVVTLVGERQVSRQGFSILSVLECPELITHTPEEYCQRCVQLANDIDYLQTFRHGIRAKMQASSLMDGVTFTRQLEEKYKNWG